MSNKEPLQLFRVSEKIWDSISYGDVAETWNDMLRAGIVHPPFREFAIEVKLEFIRRMHREIDDADDVDRAVANHMFYCEYEFEEMGPIDDQKSMLWVAKILYPNGKVSSVVTPNTELTDPELFEFAQSCATYAMGTLIVLLATRNTKTEKVENKMIAKGKTNGTNEYRKNFPVTTTISIGKITETCTKDGEDPRYVRPHLRRGHLRNQLYGPDRTMVKQIFISPVFVNASDGWIAERKAYNVSARHGRI